MNLITIVYCTIGLNSNKQFLIMKQYILILYSFVPLQHTNKLNIHQIQTLISPIIFIIQMK